MNIFLVGLMAVGKSTVGRYLADALDLPFYDTDKEIEDRAGADVSWIFDVEGEQGFRDREEQVIDDLTGRQGVVLATGGGAVLRTANRERLRQRGVVIHLDCPTARLVARTVHDRKRPLLQNGDPAETFRRLKTERGPLYESIRDYHFMQSRGGPKALAATIAEQLKADGRI